MSNEAVKNLTERAVVFLRGKDYNSLEAHSTMDKICTEMDAYFPKTAAVGEERVDPRLSAVPTFLFAVVSLDWNLWGDERVYELGEMLADVLDYLNNTEVIDVEQFSTMVLGVAGFIMGSLSSVGKERMTAVGKANYATAVISITFTLADIAKKYC